MKKNDIVDDEDLSFIDINDDQSDYDLSGEEFEGEDEYKNEYGEEDENEDKGKGKVFHIAFIIICIAILGFSGYLVVKWQKGINVVINPDDITEDFLIESMDYYVPFQPNEVDGYVDDGELNIVILGDDSIAHCQDETSIPAIIEKQTGAHVDVCALEGGRMTTLYDAYDLNHSEDSYSLIYQTTQISSGSDGSYDLMQAAWEYMDAPTKYYAFWDVLHKVNFNKADIIIISYGMNDFIEKAPILGTEVTQTQPYGLGDGVTGALTLSIDALRKRFPYAQIIVSSPTFMYATDENGEFRGADTVDYGDGPLGEYIAVMAHYSGMFRATFVDNYLMEGFNPGEYEDYLEDNKIFPNEKGREMIANHIMKYFYFNKQ